MMSELRGIEAQGGGGYPPGGYGPPGGPPPGGGGGGYGPPGGPPPGGGGGGYGPPGGGGAPPPGGYGPPAGYPPPPPGGAPPGYGGPGGYGPPGGYGYPPPAPAPNAELKKQATTWLIVGVASFFFCGGNCFGAIGGILAFLAMQAADQGNTDDAESKLKWSKIVTIAGAALMVVGIALASIWYFVVAAATIAGH